MSHPAAQVIVRDISDRKRAEAKLRESEARFRGYAESAQDLIWIATADRQKLEYPNPAFERVWERPPNGLCPKDWLESIHPENRKRQASVARS